MNEVLLLLAMVDCYSFDQTDRRTYCLAIEHRNSGECYSIRDAELRTQCRAELLGDKSLCYSISNPAERSECQMRSDRHP